MDTEFPVAPPSVIASFSIAEPHPTPPPPPPPPPVRRVASRVAEVLEKPIELEVVPLFIPHSIPDVQPAVPAGGTSGEGIVGGVEGGEIGGLVGGVVGSVAPLIAASEPEVRPVASPESKVPLHPTSQVFPEYPEEAQNSGLEGRVVLRYVIDRRGRVTEVTVLKPAESKLFDDAAVKAIRSWRFKPLQEGYEQLTREVTIVFFLERS